MDKATKNIGVIKEIDSLGRIVIPKEFRERLKLDKEVEVVLTETGVIIRNSKYRLIEFHSEQEKNGSI
jgi:AbrB family looped-hinge helix DNA binding protein